MPDQDAEREGDPKAQGAPQIQSSLAWDRSMADVITNVGDSLGDWRFPIPIADPHHGIVDSEERFVKMS